MRLTAAQIDGLIQAFDRFMSGRVGELRLHGSRVHDELKGGDIDLLVVVNSELAKELVENKHKLLAEIKRHIGDQKIDITIASSKDLVSDPFLQIIIPQSIILYHWN